MTVPADDPSWEAIDRAARFIQERSPHRPAVAVVAGSGLSALAERAEDAHRIPYAQIPGWPRGSVSGHAGELWLGSLGGRQAAVASGRVHLYEGIAPQRIVFGVRVLHALGARMLIVTNAAGGLDPDYEPGDVMVIEDHLFLPGLAGANPLVGRNDDARGPRFPPLVEAYDRALRGRAEEALADAGLSVRRGVYAMVAGPSYETPAEARYLRHIGADAVGMSTAPEVVAARHLGMRVLGISLITNRVTVDPAAADPTGDLHEEVTSVGRDSAPRIAEAIESLVARSAD